MVKKRRTVTRPCLGCSEIKKLVGKFCAECDEEYNFNSEFLLRLLKTESKKRTKKKDTV